MKRSQSVGSRLVVAVYEGWGRGQLGKSMVKIPKPASTQKVPAVWVRIERWEKEEKREKRADDDYYNGEQHRIHD